MTIPIVKDVMPFLIGSLVLFGTCGVICRFRNWRRLAITFYLLAAISSAFMLFFFRDPQRLPPANPNAILAGADGIVLEIKDVYEDQFLRTETVRISTFLSLLDVHINRAPISGKITFAGFFPGKRYFTFDERSSDFNHHNSIVIEGPHTRCLVNQIAGPVARCVVYWIKIGQPVAAGDRIGMMKFGSRLDIYLPKSDVNIIVKKHDKITAGVTVIATLKEK